MPQPEILNRYRPLRAALNHHLDAAFSTVPTPWLLDRAKAVGLAKGRNLLTDDDEEINLIADLAVHTAKPERSRAIDRYAKAASHPEGSDEALTLRALQAAQFSLWRVERFHDVAGLMVFDILRETEAWLMDEAMTISVVPGLIFASRLCWPAEFAMTCGVLVPLGDLPADLMMDSLPWLRHGDGAKLAADPRFAAQIYRLAIGVGAMERVTHIDAGELPRGEPGGEPGVGD